MCVCESFLFLFLRSRSVIRVHLSVSFEPSKINVFNKECRRAGKDVTCMAAIVCVRVTAQTPMPPTQGVGLYMSCTLSVFIYMLLLFVRFLTHTHTHLRQSCGVSLV